MANILDYIKWRGDIDFYQSEFNEIDALILSQICYLNFDSLLKESDFSCKVSLEELARIFMNSKDYKTRCDLGVLINKQTVNLLIDASKSKRFGNILVVGYSSIIDVKNDEQFSAMTFCLPEKTNFVAFRGTDDTIVGWKEDFNLALKDAVPAQNDSVLYLEKTADFLEGDFLIGGHSKGGNLAIFSSAFCSDGIKNRVKGIYNLDGPGFLKSRLESTEFLQILPKVHSFYPHFSIVGMMFEHAGEYHVVESDQSGIMQHDPFSWHVLGKNFCFEENFDKASKLFHEVFNKWIVKLSEEQREQFVETLFGIIQATDARTNSEIEKNLLQNSVKIAIAYAKMDGDVKDALEETVKLFFKTISENLPPLQKIIKYSVEKQQAKATQLRLAVKKQFKNR